MSKTDKILSRAAFTAACAAVLAAPWLFGAWEDWWFWPVVAVIFLSTGLFALRLVLAGPGALQIDIQNRRYALMLAGSCLLFLAYAFGRAVASDVYMDAERSFLMYLFPFLLAVQVVFGFSRSQKKTLMSLIMINIFVIGVYGIANHFITHNHYVLWAEGYEAYYSENRATGPLFCPDHFAGVMEMGFCLGLAILMTRRIEWRRKIFPACLVLLALTGVVLSKSRGGGMTIIVILLTALVWGLSQWRKFTRWYYRLTCFASLILALMLFCALGKPYMERFKSIFGEPGGKEESVAKTTQRIALKLRTTSRGHMYTGALRAWTTSPLWGIGAGMHQNLWPHFSNSGDGDRETDTWPTYYYANHHSYVTHSDWLQLLEEYGLAGFILFLAPFTVIFIGLVRSRRIEHAAGLGALLAFVGMSFHSLGDFNLQIPGITCMFAVIISLPLGKLLEQSHSRENDIS